ncbi:MAG TPA: Clp protease N-terminal domain-containing protein [Terriglobales bacterium]|nr:Clp protease N-terminal domain-containing protein [Terriglobales bacterium]
MFERYTEKARRVIFFARYEASAFGSPYIESEHLLLGFLRESKALSAKVFSGPLFTVDDIRREIEKHTTFREKIATSVDLPLSNECRRILHYASEEADRLGHKHIGTEHLLAGMLREEDCYAAGLLRERGVSLEIIRKQIQGEEPARELAQAKSPGIPAGHRWKSLLYNPASESIIVEMARADTGHLPMSRLFTRHKSAAGYELLGNPSDEVSYECPVTCEKRPIVIFNSVRWAGGGGSPDGVYTFNLDTKELTICIAKDALKIAAPHLRSWILTLVSLSDDGQKLYLKVGIEKPVSGSGVVDYYLASLSVSDKKLELLSQLKDVRF